MDIERLEAEYLDNLEILEVLHEVKAAHSRGLAAREKLRGMETMRAQQEEILDQDPAQPGYAEAKAWHADRANTISRSLTKWNRLFKEG